MGSEARIDFLVQRGHINPMGVCKVLLYFAMLARHRHVKQPVKGSTCFDGSNIAAKVLVMIVCGNLYHETQFRTVRRSHL